MFEILPNLYLSTWNQVRVATDDFDFFQVNCTKDLPMVRSNGMRIDIDDDPGEAQQLLCDLADVVQRIDEELAKPGRKVVVHCLAAVSRSPSVMCAYLMWKYRMPLTDAIAHVRRIRREAFMFSMNFKDALEMFELSCSSSR